MESLRFKRLLLACECGSTAVQWLLGFAPRRAAGRAACGSRTRWPRLSRPSEHGLASRPRRCASSTRSTTGCPSWSASSQGRAPASHSWSRRRVDDGRIHNRASLDLDTLGLQVRVHRVSISPPRSCSSSICRNRRIVVSSRAGATPRSTPTNRRIATDSNSASSGPGSDRLNHCCTKYVRNMIDNPTGWRLLPAFA
jgi:hypothetical protein